MLVKTDDKQKSISMVAAAFLVVLIRLLATRYCWDLPKATTDEIG